MYYFSLPTERKIDLTSTISVEFTTKNKEKKTDSLFQVKEILKSLSREGYLYLADLNLLILQKPEYITQAFPDAKFDEIFCRYLIETAIPFPYKIPKNADFHQKSSSKQDQIFRVLIDPEQ